MTIHQILLSETILRICTENMPRIRTCIAQLDQDQIWYRPNAEMVSIGNLILHLHGNARQWILHTLCGIQWERDRDKEFSELGPLPVGELSRLLDGLEQDLKQYVVTIEEEALLQSYDVQIFHETGVAILVHVIEHFSYHTGQIARDTKRMLAKDLRFYETEDL
ncbi:MAG: DUF1572 family protein [Saprospiraceae bacterium]|nr:DUF1572 family protein [Saprospiraceae bacterium]